MQHDLLVLTLFRRELRASLDSTRRADLLWIGIGGAALLAYATADLVFALRAVAGPLRRSPWLWPAGLPGAALLLGFAAGLCLTRLAMSRAHSAFLRALPLSGRQRRRMSIAAAGIIGAALTAVVVAFASIACILIARPHAFVWSAAIASLFATGIGAGMVVRLARSSFSDPEAASSAGFAARSKRTFPMPGRLDRLRPTWLGAWAWNLPAGQVVLSWRLAASGVGLGLVAAVSAATGLAQHNAAPGALTGLAGGLLVFMLGLRCHPLGSPVLRTAPIGFGRAWLRLVWLPLVLSAAFFLLPAGTALAAEPSAWPLPVASGLWLLVLNAIYAVFAAYFMTAPLLAAFSFLAAIAYTGYESLEYGRTVAFGLAGLVMWLWYRARQRYYHG